jgi:hypothetical protein
VRNGAGIFVLAFAAGFTERMAVRAISKSAGVKFGAAEPKG